MKKTLILFACFILLTSHELFLKTDSYFLRANEKSELYLYNGTFDQSENTITRDRIIDPKIIGPDFEFIPGENDYYDEEKVTYLKFKSGIEGTYIAGISTLPKILELSAEEFNEYLDHEGLIDVISERKERGLLNTSARERYSKHVKAIFQVNGSRTDHYKTVLNYPIEFVPNNNPYSLNKGDKLSLTLLRDGEPLANQIVHYSCRLKTGTHEIKEESTRTDSKGTFTIKLDQTGFWYVAAIHMVESEKKDVDYISNWATLTFEIK